MQDSPKKPSRKRGRQREITRQAAVARKKQMVEEQGPEARYGELLHSFLREYQDQERRWDNPDQNSEKDFAAFIDYVVNFLKQKPGESRMECALRTLDLTSHPQFTNDHVTQAYSRWGSMLLRLHLQLKFSRMENYEGGRLVLACFSSIRAVAHARKFVRADLEYLQAIDPRSERMGSSKDADRELIFQDLSPESSDGEVLARHVLGELYAHRLGRRNGAVYRKVYTEDGIDTHTWTRMADIKEFIHISLDHVGAANVTSITWKNRGIVDGVEKWLKECKHPWFPEILPRRGLYSFRNGMLSVEEDPVRFWEWGDEDLPTNMVACKYFDQEFDRRWATVENPIDIPTPAADKVIRYQLHTKVKATPDPEEMQAAADDAERVELQQQSHMDNVTECMEWIYALIGRLQHPVRKHDNWEVLLTVIGRAGTGKSTLMEAIMNMYDKEDVRQLAGNADQFSIASLVGGLLWMCTEMSDKVRIPQMQLQQMVTGEAMSVRPIHADWIHIPRWESPGVIGGNVLPPWADNQGSLSRRLLVLTFGRAIANSEKDPRLKDKLSMEMGAFICKVARYYFMAVQEYGNYILWSDCPVLDEEGNKVLDEDGQVLRRPVLPPYFHEQSAAVKRELDPLRMFLSEAPLCWNNYRTGVCEQFKEQIGENQTIRIRTENAKFFGECVYMMPFSVFKEQATLFMNDLGNEGKAYKWKEAVYREALLDNELFLFVPSTQWQYGDRTYGGKWVAGICEMTALTENNPLGFNLVGDAERDEAPAAAAAGGGGAQ